MEKKKKKRKKSLHALTWNQNPKPPRSHSRTVEYFNQQKNGGMMR